MRKNYIQSQVATHTFSKGSRIINYPNPTQQDRDIYRAFLKKSSWDFLDLEIWKQLRLYALEPSWMLGSKKRKQERASVIRWLSKDFSDWLQVTFLPLSLWQATPYHQEEIFLNAATLYSLGFQDFGNKLLMEVQKRPSSWAFTIQMAEWLLTDLQLDEHTKEQKELYDYLEVLRTTPYNEEVSLEEQVDLWLSQFIGVVSLEDLNR